MAFEPFADEQQVISDSDELLKSELNESAFRPAYAALLKEYKKLYKTSNRLVHMSDRSEEGLKEANAKIQAQQVELEQTHAKLEKHADLLEEKVRERTRALEISQAKLERLVSLGISLSLEQNSVRFSEMILAGAKELTHADGATLYIRTLDNRLEPQIVSYDTLDMHRGGTSELPVQLPVVTLRDPVTMQPNYFNMVAHAVLTERTVRVGNSYESVDFDHQAQHQFDIDNGYRTLSLMAVPLKPRGGETIGVLQLINARKSSGGRTVPFTEEMVEMVGALASQAAVAHQNQELVTSQERLLDSIIKLTASAIDAKSPYTGGHCERVPEIGKLLAQAACETEEGLFAEFDMSEEQWREFEIGAWLHDCGKVTTPDYVMDKATKLETIYNRIHEVRQRFEIKHRDYQLEALQAQLEGGDKRALEQQLGERLQQLQDDFAFVAECNVGGEFMVPERVERLRAIAAIEWTRYFDDRLGLSQDEEFRLQGVVKKRLPATEKLISDKKEHLFPYPKGELPYRMEAYGFKMQAPKYLNNTGELYNLSIPKGTLNSEERYKINEHMIQTVIMLDQLPFPRNLSQVPHIACNHHETMIGTGYPRQLTKADMSVQARIMAIADIFEALTASDRPYKKAKPLSESLRIMSFMRNDQHIDADLFELFLTSGAYLDYARRFLHPDQIDGVDIDKLLQRPEAKPA
ncbi:GAF domain-containing protein [Ectothiorhodospiraceae bacterium BW-2]|nr:GAF domain-containing protein [Ectothiorhodospiraceae bacterium BW-2]